MLQTWILIGITVAVSWLAFERPRLLDRLTLWPPAIDKYGQYDERFGHLYYKDKFSHYRLRVEYRFVGDQCPGGPAEEHRDRRPES